MKTCPTCRLRYPDETTFCFIDGATLQSAGRGPEGRTVGGLYVVDDLVGKGPTSATYRAQFRLADATCAIKLLAEPLAPEHAATFVAAVKTARRYDHPYVAAPWGGGVTADGIPYVVRSLFDAESLAGSMARGPMRPERAVPIAAQILRGLCRIHDFGGVHGDLKPSNVLVSRDGRVRLVDAGCGRSLHRPLWDPQAEVADTISLLAPELHPSGARQPEIDRAMGNAASAPADLYALGALVFRMLSGRPHLEASSPDELRSKLQEPRAVPPSGTLPVLPQGLGPWIDELLEPTAAARPNNAHQVLHDLEAVALGAAIALPEAAQLDREALEEATQLAPLFGRWDRYGVIFKRMMDQGFPGGAAGQAKLAFDLIRGKSQDLQELGQQAQEQHRALAAVFRRAREGRSRIAEQMASHVERIRSAGAETRPIEREIALHDAALADLPRTFADRHRELIQWEGRSGLREPSRELAQAYRVVADLVDRWWALHSEQASAAARLREHGTSLERVHAELEELRTALRIHESNTDSELEAYEQALASLTARLDELEPDLLDQATRFTAPLRAKPELGACFRELQQVAG